MRYTTIVPLVWGLIYGSHVTVNGIMSPFEQDHCRMALTSSMWLSAEYEPYAYMSMVDDYMPFSVYNQDYVIGEEEAFGIPGLVLEEERDTEGAMSDYTGYVSFHGQPAFMKCSYKLDWYDREVYALIALRRMDPRMLVTLPWKGYAGLSSPRNLLAQVLSYFRTADGYGCMVLELVDGITLKEYAAMLSPLQKDVALKDVARQLVVSLDYIHRNGWAHCDLKARNVMVNILPPSNDGKPQARVTLIDFNLALPIVEDFDPPHAHSIGMSPPEFYKKKEVILEAYDAWQLGALFYSLFMNRAPYEIDYPREGQKKNWSNVRRRKFMRDLLVHQQHSYTPLNCSSDARDFIEILMEVDPKKRPTMRELIWHKWLR
ncbi:kinase-like domain-containing protein [Syncephalis plumigaleata]|nr:kinase-like domain-containing protein [Syncephalis plumigaleata]